MHDLENAARTLARVVDDVDDLDLDRPTPCAQWTVRDLLRHLLGLTAHFTGVARRSPARPAPEELPEDWPARLDEHLDDLVAAWRDPLAWTGDGEAGGVVMPRAELAVVALEEIVLHGWDLAVAVGAPFAVDDADLALVRGFVEGFEHADESARAGLYGPVVAAHVGDPLAEVLALAGRDPAQSRSTASPTATSP